jgi:hypothetical protein
MPKKLSFQSISVILERGRRVQCCCRRMIRRLVCFRKLVVFSTSSLQELVNYMCRPSMKDLPETGDRDSLTHEQVHQTHQHICGSRFPTLQLPATKLWAIMEVFSSSLQELVNYMCRPSIDEFVYMHCRSTFFGTVSKPLV